MLFYMSSVIQPTLALDALSTPFTKEENDYVVSFMPVDKAPGPDGFNGQFIKSC
jgi:hypothetical protein